MKAIVNGKRYDTETATLIAERDVYRNGLYAGSDRIGVTPKGAVFAWQTSNGQDCYRGHGIIGPRFDPDFLDGMTIVNEELAKKHNLFDEA